VSCVYILMNMNGKNKIVRKFSNIPIIMCFYGIKAKTIK
jgi:hypothetical protein